MMYHLLRLLIPRFFKFSLLFFFVIVLANPADAQLTVSQNLSVTQLLQTLFGGGITISNLSTSCDTTLSMGSFNGTNSNLGLSTGVILSTGNVNSAPGPNNQTGVTGVMNTPGNPLLTSLSGQATFDACVIEFDITPLCDTIAISYVFASDEYPEFVGSINDVFAFFISGPGIVGNQNIALVPGTSTGVAINTINANSFSQYYVNNTGGTSIQYDGFTVPLQAYSPVTPCETYHIIIAIADASDNILDSSVFLEAGGIGCSTPVLQLTAANEAAIGANVAVEECVNGVINFSVPVPLPVATTFHFTIGGTATPGLDYVVFPDSIVIPAGQSTASLPITVIADSIADGLEYIQLVYTDSNLCATQIYSDTAFLVILDPPGIYDAVDAAFCADDSVTIGVTPVSGQQYQWSPATGLSDPEVGNPTISLSNPTDTAVSYTYILTTIALQGFCEYQDTIEVTVYPANQAGFVADTVCQSFTTSFTDLTLADTIVSWNWSFGDGTGAIAQNPTHLYTAPGIYPVELITLNGSGCADTLSQDVEVLPLPVFAISADTVCLGTPTTFVNNTSPALTFFWDFGDGATSTLGSPSHVYAAAGVYAVQVIAETAAGCSDSLSFDVVVHENPVAAFSGESVCFSQSTSFTNLSTPGSGTALSYQWNFGDNTFFSTQENPSHLYGGFGLYTVSLTTTDENACSATASQTISVYPAVTADFTYTPVCFGGVTPFTDLSIADPSGPIQSWKWDFGDGNDDTDEDPLHIYGSYGVYNAKLTVTTIFNCKDSVVKPVEVWDEPIAGFDFTSRCDNEPISFTNRSGYNTSDVSWSWSFGDGASGNQENPTHLYPTFGDYTVLLTITNSKGCQDTVSQQVAVYPLPRADFLAPPVCFGLATQFEDQTEIAAPGELNAYRWEFGQGGASTSFGQAALTYPTPGIYPVELWVRSADGCLDSMTQSITVWPRPVVQFSTENVCTGDSAFFENLSTITDSVTGDFIASWSWDFGDGRVLGSLPSVEHVYRESGTYPVVLTAVSDKGCEASRSRPAIMFPLPDAPAVQGDSVCFSNPAFLLASPDFPGVRVEWFSALSALLPFHTDFSYMTPPLPYEATYYVEAISDFACRSTRVPVSAFVYGERAGVIVASDTVVEIPDAVIQFYVAGTFSPRSIRWYFGDGTNAEGLEATHKYLLPGIYEVQAVIEDGSGCEATLTQLVEIKKTEGLFIPSAFSPNQDGSNDVFYIGHRLIQTFQIQVFNRWGQLVYESSDPDFQWDGSGISGQRVREGVYVYHIQAQDIDGIRQDQSGTITILY